MNTAVLALLASLQGPSADPVTVTAIDLRETGGVWVVRAKVGETEGLFVLSTGAARTSLRSAPTSVGEGQSLPVRIEGLDFGTVPVQTEDLPGAPAALKGIIGLDALKGRMVGFNLERTEITFWPKGLAPAESARLAEAWVRPSGGEKARTIKFLESRAGYPLVPVKFGTTPLALLVSTGVGTLAISMAHTKPGEFLKVGTTPQTDVRTGERIKRPYGLVGPLVIEGQNLPPLPAILSEEDGLAIDPDRPEGSVPIISLPFPRLLLDFGRSCMVVQTVPSAELDDRWLTAQSGLPLRISGDRLLIAEEQDTHFAGKFLPYKGQEVLDIGGLKGPEIVRAVRSRNAKSLDLALALAKAMRTGYTARIQQPTGVYELKVAKP